MTEIEKLDVALTEMNIGHEHIIMPMGGGDMIVAYTGRFGTKYLFDVVCNEFSYGGKQGLLEAMGKWLVGNRDVHGWLTADDVIELVKKKLEKDNIRKTTQHE